MVVVKFEGESLGRYENAEQALACARMLSAMNPGKQVECAVLDLGSGAVCADLMPGNLFVPAEFVMMAYAIATASVEAGIAIGMRKSTATTNEGTSAWG